MKHLTLIRHAKSSWDDASLSDHDRPLAPRGLKAAPVIGRALAERFGETSDRLLPDIAVTSTAVRARETAELVLESMGAPFDAREDAQLYGASTGEIRSVVRHLEEDVQHVLLFGHNPGFHWVCSEIDSSFQLQKYPTCAVASFDLAIDYWGEGIVDRGKLAFFLKPKDLA